MKLLLDDKNIAKAGKLARNIHLEGYHCSETMIRTLWPYLLPDEELTELTMKMTMVMHGGIADSMGSHCGGLSVGILLIGAIYGRTDIDGDARFAPAVARKYWQGFLDEFGTSHCTTLRSNNILTGEAPTRCGCIIVRSVHLLLRTIREVEQRPAPIEEMYLWRLDRTNEPCHEKVPPMKSSEEIKAEKQNSDIY